MVRYWKFQRCVSLTLLTSLFDLSFKAFSLSGIDYFKDSTLFILSTPGHHAGSISLLVLTSLEPIPTYHLLAGDAAHHISLLRGAANGVYKAKENPMRDQPDEDGEKEETFELDVGKFS